QEAPAPPGRVAGPAERWGELRAPHGEPPQPRDGKEGKNGAPVSPAGLRRDRLDRKDLAVETLGKVLALDAGNWRALKIVAAALSEDGDWSGLVALYEAALKVRRVDNAETRQLTAQLGSVLFDKLGNGD